MKAQKLGWLAMGLASSCCVIPIALALIGLGGTALVRFFGVYHWWLQAAAAVLLAAAWWFFLREKRRLAGLGAAVKNARLTVTVLSLATAALAGFSALNIWGATRLASAGPPVQEAGRHTVVISVKGMSCAGCALHVEGVVKALDGVSSVRADLARAEVRVTYDPKRVTPDRIVEQIRTKTPYEARLAAARPEGGRS
ncbi:MAG TPA: heavy metal-associated domain-containing protein [Bryobacteraceae bacterium]|nr:heavy metal-associated domain-containing protein [Bryobacteraceae bacterium]